MSSPLISISPLNGHGIVATSTNTIRGTIINDSLKTATSSSTAVIATSIFPDASKPTSVVINSIHSGALPTGDGASDHISGPAMIESMTTSTSSSCPPTSTITTASQSNLSRLNMLCTISLFISCCASLIMISVVIGVVLDRRRRKTWQPRDDGEARPIEPSHITIIIKQECQASSSLGTPTATAIETPASFGIFQPNAYQNLNGAPTSHNPVNSPCVGRQTTPTSPRPELEDTELESNFELPGNQF